MKQVLILLATVLLSVSLWSQVPQSFSYQAVVRDANNELVKNKSVGMKISLLQGSENGNESYVETHIPTANDHGLVSIAIGAGTKVSGDFIAIDWSKGVYFIKIEMDPTGGTNYTLTSVSQLLSVPYALYAANTQPGPKGEKGDTGPKGLPGKDGVDGKNGNDGKDGVQGPKGDQGPIGISKDEQKLSVSPLGDTLFLQNGGFILVPGVSLANSNLSGNTHSKKSTFFYINGIGQITSSEFQKVDLATNIKKIYNPNNLYNINTNEYEIPVDGTYKFEIKLSNTGNLNIKKNGTNIYLFGCNSDTASCKYGNTVNEFIPDLKMGDMITFWATGWNDMSSSYAQFEGTISIYKID